MNNNELSIKEMLDSSNQLFELNKDKWAERTPESNIYWVAWLVGEVGEVIDIIKKKGVDKIMNHTETRQEMLEEISDCYMYLADILNRYEFSATEFSEAYRKKMNHNLTRDYSTRKTNKDKNQSINC